MVLPSRRAGGPGGIRARWVLRRWLGEIGDEARAWFETRNRNLWRPSMPRISFGRRRHPDLQTSAQQWFEDRGWADRRRRLVIDLGSRTLAPKDGRTRVVGRPQIDQWLKEGQLLQQCFRYDEAWAVVHRFRDWREEPKFALLVGLLGNRGSFLADDSGDIRRIGPVAMVAHIVAWIRGRTNPAANRSDATADDDVRKPEAAKSPVRTVKE